MGLVQNRVKVSLKLDKEYTELNRLKFVVSVGVFSYMVMPKVMAMLDYMPDGSVARQEKGIVYVMIDKIPQMENLLSYCELTEVNFYDSFISVNASFSNKSGINLNDIPSAIEDSWSDTTSLKDRETGNTFKGIARAIFESDKVDEGLQILREKATELKDTHGDELQEAALSWLKSIRRSRVESSSEEDGSANK